MQVLCFWFGGTACSFNAKNADLQSATVHPTALSVLRSLRRFWVTYSPAPNAARSIAAPSQIACTVAHRQQWLWEVERGLRRNPITPRSLLTTSSTLGPPPTTRDLPLGWLFFMGPIRATWRAALEGKSAIQKTQAQLDPKLRPIPGRTGSTGAFS